MLRQKDWSPCRTPCASQSGHVFSALPVRGWWKGAGDREPLRSRGAKAAQPRTHCAQALGAEGTFFLSMMSILSLLAISQSFLGCQIYCRPKFGVLLGDFATLTISHDHLIEMKPEVALFIATKINMNMTEFPGATVQTPVPHWITLSPSIAKGDSVSIIRRCRAPLQHPKEDASLWLWRL